jgi:hypothetical protein
VHFARGVELMQQARWQDAIRELEAAGASRATAALMFNLGLAYRAVGRDRDAVGAFTRFLALAAGAADPARRAEVEGYVRELTAALSQLRLDVAPPSASVSIDGVPATSAIVDLDPGRHRIQVTAPGFDPVTREIVAQPGARSDLTLRLTPTDVTASLHVESNVRDAIIRIDGRAAGSGVVDQRLPPGRYAVDIRAPHRESFRRTVVLGPREHARIQAVLATPGRSVAGPVLGSTAGVLLTAGLIVVGIVVFSRTEDPYVGSLGLSAGH